MANLLIINYQEVTSESINVLLNRIATVAMLIDWDFKNSQIKIKWRWEEEKQVEEFLSMLQVAVKEANIFMINEEKESKQEVNEEPTILKNENLQEKMEDVNPANEQIISENESEAVEEKAPKISNEEALKKLLEPMISKYKFTLENSEEMATKFCSEFGIRGEAFRSTLTLVSVARSEVEIYKLLSKALEKNSARIKMEVSASFKRWISNSYPEFFKEYADIKVTDLLNIFREDGKKL